MAVLLVVLIVASVWLLCCIADPRDRSRAAVTAPPPSRQKMILAAARESFVTGMIGIDELEQEIDHALDPAPPDQRIEVHVYGTPPAGTQIHIHI